MYDSVEQFGVFLSFIQYCYMCVLFVLKVDIVSMFIPRYDIKDSYSQIKSVLA